MTGNELRRFEAMLSSMAFGNDDQLYGTDWTNRRVVRLDTTTGASETFVASAAGGLYGPSGLTFRGDDLYVTSRITGEVLRFDAETGAFRDSFARSARNGPQRTTVGPDGNLYVANDSCDCIHRFDGDSGTFLDVFVTANVGLSDGATPVFGPDGNFYLSTWTSGILKFDVVGRYLDTLDMSFGATGFTFASSSWAAPVPEAATGALWLAALAILPMVVPRRRRAREALRS